VALETEVSGNWQKTVEIQISFHFCLALCRAFSVEYHQLVPSLIQSTLRVFEKLRASRAHLGVNFLSLSCQQISQLVRGLMFSTPETVPEESALKRLWFHEVRQNRLESQIPSGCKFGLPR